MQGLESLIPMIRNSLMSNYASTKIEPVMGQIQQILQPFMGSSNPFNYKSAGPISSPTTGIGTLPLLNNDKYISDAVSFPFDLSRPAFEPVSPLDFQRPISTGTITQEYNQLLADPRPEYEMIADKYAPGSQELFDYATEFNNNVRPGSLTYMNPETGSVAY